MSNNQMNSGRCGCECGGCTSPVGDAVSFAGDFLPSPKFGICDTTLSNGKVV